MGIRDWLNRFEREGRLMAVELPAGFKRTNPAAGMQILRSFYYIVYQGVISKRQP